MTVEISSAVLARIVAEADAFHRREVCGLLIGRPGRVTAALSCRNVAADPAHAFEIDPAQLIAAHRAARAGAGDIVGCYHSHPGGSPLPSPRDAAAAAPDGSIWIIVAGHGTGCYRAVEHGRHEGRFDVVELKPIRC